MLPAHCLQICCCSDTAAPTPSCTAMLCSFPAPATLWLQLSLLFLLQLLLLLARPAAAHKSRQQKLLATCGTSSKFLCAFVSELGPHYMEYRTSCISYIHIHIFHTYSSIYRVIYADFHTCSQCKVWTAEPVHQMTQLQSKRVISTLHTHTHTLWHLRVCWPSYKPDQTAFALSPDKCHKIAAKICWWRFSHLAPLSRPSQRVWVCVCVCRCAGVVLRVSVLILSAGKCGNKSNNKTSHRQ